MGKRRSSRELTLKFLYQCELNQGVLKDQIEQFCERTAPDGEVEFFLRDLVGRIFDHKRGIDETLKKYSENWTLDRMTVIDRNILRIGACELLYSAEVPPKVAINEAVEIAKKFGSEESPEFINGILDKIYKEVTTGYTETTTP